MKSQKVRKIDPNRCNKKLLEYSQNKIDNGWVKRNLLKWKQDSIANKSLIEGTDPFYTYKEYKYARIIAGYLPQDIPECWRVKCVVEAYDELFVIDKEKKEAKQNEKDGIKTIQKEKRTKFDFGKIKEKNKR